MKSICWNVKFFNPTNQELLKEERHTHIQSLADKYPHIPLPTWRNMGMGRSKIYEPFIKLKKEYISTAEQTTETPLLEDDKTSSNSTEEEN